MKYTTINKTREVPVTIDGETKMVPEDYKERVPKVPHSMDRTVRSLMMAFTSFMLVGAVVWSTVAIGSLLSMVAPAWAAYMIAVIFDSAWILCLMGEWLARYDNDRAKLPKMAGWVFLALSMVLISVHGGYEDALFVGICGAAVSAVAKFSWRITMGTIAIRLDDKHAGFLRIKRQEAGVKFALASQQADIDRTEARTRDLKLALEAQTGETVSATRETAPVSSVETPSQPLLTVSHGRETLPEGVETLLSHLNKGETLSASKAAEMLGVSRATGGRRLAEAKAAYAAQINNGTGQYL